MRVSGALLVKEVLDRADEIRVHDEWSKKSKLQREYQDYLKKRLEEIRKQRGSN